MNSKGYPSNFFKTNQTIHCITGVLVFNNEKFALTKYFLYAWSIIIYIMTGWFLILEFLIVKKTMNDVSQFFSQFGLLICHCLCVVKFVLLMGRHEKLKEIMGDLQDENYQYEILGDFNPGQHLSEAQTLSQRCSIFVFCLYSCAGFSAHISSKLQLSKDIKENYFISENKTCYDYVPYYFVMPFATNTKRQCEYNLIFMDIGLDMFAWLAASHDSFYAALLNCLRAQLDILGGAMRTIRPRVLKRLRLPQTLQIFKDHDFPLLEEALHSELTHLTKHLMTLLRVADDLEAIFNLVTLGQTVTSLIVFASCLFVTTSIPITSPGFFAQLEYFTCMLIQLSMFCWFGSAITKASESIPMAIYESDWYGSSRRFKKSMLTTMCRMQKPIYMTIGKFCPLRLNAIAMVCKASFSYYTVFKRADE